MATKLCVIITKDKVYGTYYNTICAEQSYTNEDTMWEAINNVRATTFGYGLTFSSVLLFEVNLPEAKNSNHIFEYLEKIHTIDNLIKRKLI